jgi:hypothetical protein
MFEMITFTTEGAQGAPNLGLQSARQAALRAAKELLGYAPSARFPGCPKANGAGWTRVRSRTVQGGQRVGRGDGGRSLGPVVNRTETWLAAPCGGAARIVITAPNRDAAEYCVTIERVS